MMPIADVGTPLQRLRPWGNVIAYRFLQMPFNLPASSSEPRVHW